MTSTIEFHILLIGTTPERLSALGKIMENHNRYLVPFFWSEDVPEQLLEHPVCMIVVDAVEPKVVHSNLIRDLRSRFRGAPVVFILDNFDNFSFPKGDGAIDVVPMNPEIIRFKVDTLLKMSLHELELEMKEELVKSDWERLEKERRYQKEIEGILSENEQTLRRIFQSVEATSEAIMLTEKNEIVYYTNPAFSSLTGYSMSDVFGMSASNFFTFHDASISLDEMKAIALATGSWQGDVTLRRKDNTLYQAYLDVNAVTNLNKSFEGFIFIQRDISTLKKIMHELETLARIDSLTGLYNRRYFMERLADEFPRIKRYGHPLCLLILDLDHFKNINDTYGHCAGDLVLAAFGRIVRQLLRETDVSGRYGGEEFCLALPNTTLEGGLALAERVRRHLEEEVFQYEDSATFKATCSIGIAVFHGEIEDAAHCFSIVDTALYRAKQLGRNRTEIAHPS